MGFYLRISMYSLVPLLFLVLAMILMYWLARKNWLMISKEHSLQSRTFTPSLRQSSPVSLGVSESRTGEEKNWIHNFFIYRTIPGVNFLSNILR